MIRLLSLTSALLLVASISLPAIQSPMQKPTSRLPQDTVIVVARAPAFKIKDTNGKEIDLAELTAIGPVLVRLTCGCSGCDKELAYFNAIHESYKNLGQTSLAVFQMPDDKSRRLC